MSLKRFEEFASAYRQYRREKNSPVDGIFSVATIATVICAATGGYIAQKTGDDANGYSLAALGLALLTLSWLIRDTRRFTKLRAGKKV